MRSSSACVNDDGVVALAERFRRHIAHAPLHRVTWMSGARKRVAAGRRRSAARRDSSSGSTRFGRSTHSRRPARTTPRAAMHSATAQARSGSSRRSRSRSAAAARGPGSRTEGQLYTCLFAVKGHDLRGPLRSGASAEELARSIRGVWHTRSDRYSDLRTAEDWRPCRRFEMSYIGGVICAARERPLESSREHRRRGRTPDPPERVGPILASRSPSGSVSTSATRRYGASPTATPARRSSTACAVITLEQRITPHLIEQDGATRCRFVGMAPEPLLPGRTGTPSSR